MGAVEPWKSPSVATPKVTELKLFVCAAITTGARHRVGNAVVPTFPDTAVLVNGEVVPDVSPSPGLATKDVDAIDDGRHLLLGVVVHPIRMVNDSALPCCGSVRLPRHGRFPPLTHHSSRVSMVPVTVLAVTEYVEPDDEVDEARTAE